MLLLLLRHTFMPQELRVTIQLLSKKNSRWVPANRRYMEYGVHRCSGRMGSAWSCPSQMWNSAPRRSLSPAPGCHPRSQNGRRQALGPLTAPHAALCRLCSATEHSNCCLWITTSETSKLLVSGSAALSPACHASCCPWRLALRTSSAPLSRTVQSPLLWRRIEESCAAPFAPGPVNNTLRTELQQLRVPEPCCAGGVGREQG